MISKYLDKEKLPFWILFLLLWSFIWIRVFTVPLIYDEIHTKWIYMIEYNPLPYMGYVDANNHFLNSLIGGLLIRITGSDADWVIRLASVMAFPIYFWSVYAFRKFFQNKSSFYLFLTVFYGTMFLLDYFNLARGYGLSLAFLMLALQQSFDYIYEPTNKKPYK